ncbi:aldehyde dehydrogenase [Punctularia strigosozonata HHB-11173 SS5]|uniref:aldehyde dehydrogenase n=1 Tax=Punctularia strigosozonata (strain HHB-11173) TaxID=741275 RepID=UPI000441746D|nr:aldehyde dehydrogenase [Punctularia strigosozonata HHB-11173 SS5]EIN08992.1 aldehyde dehydrogenase [Punctularia strigosozonata HHB-11173 SS5]
MASIPVVNLFIDGEWRPASNQDTFEVRNPLSNEVVSIAASATLDDSTAAVEAAGRAFKTWEHSPLPQRRSVFLKAAELIGSEKYKAKIVETIRAETAATQTWAAFDSAYARGSLEHYASLVADLKGETFPSIVPGGHVIAQRRAMGVIYAISPWNAPIILTIRAIAIPIICGNTVVLKSSEYSPRTQAIVVEALHEASLPKGVLNYICTGRENSPILTPAIIAHPFVKKINFTGSDRVGKLIAAEAAKYLKPCVFELGGKAPAVVLEDADLDEAARSLVYGSMLHSGQICMSTERVICQKSISKPLLDAISSLAERLKAGDHDKDPANVQLSALFNSGSAENVVNMIKEAQEGGAEVVLGKVDREGAVVQPHIVRGVKPGMRLWDRESFGPVMVFAEAETVDELVELANASEYSMVSSLWTKDVNQALDVAGRIRSGCCNVNGPTFHSEMMRGHGGLGGATGYGHFAIDDFTDIRMVVVHPPHRQYPLVG